MTIQPMATWVHARRPPSGGSGRTIDDWWVLLVPILSRSCASIADKFWSGAVSALQWMPLIEMKWFFADGEVGNWRCRRRYRPGRSDVRGEASHDSQGMRLYKDHLDNISVNRIIEDSRRYLHSGSYFGVEKQVTFAWCFKFFTMDRKS